jgi:hypothetical protein
MQKPLADVIAEINRSGSTGILSIGIKNDASLFKIFFRAGVIYHMTHGTCRDTDCLTKLSGLDIDSAFFLPGARVDMTDRTLPPTEQVIATVRTSGKMVRWDERPGSGTDNSPETAPIRSVLQGTAVDARTLADMEDELLNIAGPVAQMVLNSAYDKCNLRKGVPITRIDFSRLVETASAGLPEEQKKAFLARFS